MRKDFIVKKVRVSILPKCNFDCNEDAIHDAPTRMGPWAHMCPEHSAQHGKSVELLGTEFVLGIAEPKGGNPIDGILDMDRTINEEMLIINCPECKDEKYLELDASGNYLCDGCGSTINIPSIL